MSGSLARSAWKAGAIAGVLVFVLKWIVGAQLFDSAAMAGNPWTFGFEVGHIAGNLAAGHGFAVSREAGVYIPTAWVSPLYPLLIAGVFKVFGAYTQASAEALLALNCAFQGATAALLFWMAARWWNTTAGWLAVALFAANPNGWQFLSWVWPSHLFAFTVLLHIAALVWPASNPRTRGVAIGGSFALALMADGAAIAIAPVTLLHLFWQGADARRAVALVALLAFALGVAPWTIRNSAQFGGFNPLRGNVGVNLWVGNYPGAEAESFHGLAPSPWHDANEGERFARLGERSYDRDARGRALDVIGNDPVRFVKNTLARFVGFWFGEWWTGWGHIAAVYSIGLALLSGLALFGGIRARASGTGALLVALLFFGGPYYLTVHGHGRYRVPVEPLMCLLAVARPLREARVAAEEEST
jgi:hypothetical protein